MFGWVSSFFTYETTKSVVVKSWLVGVINRVAQLLIIIYFVGYVFIHEKAYQVRDTGIESAVMTKVKGISMLNGTSMDVADYVFPTQGASVFSIITRMIKTENQRQDTCPETDPRFSCNTTEDCKNHRLSNLASGKITGICLTDLKKCEIRGWCPPENDRKKTDPMEGVGNFTIYIKNSIRFPRFNVKRTNILPSVEKRINSVNNSCHYDAVNDPYCPIFRVKDVLKYVNEEFSHVSKQGAEIGINIDWRCNLDKPEEDCKPKYNFMRLDSAYKHNTISKGYNFRFAKYYMVNNGTENVEYRTLHKAYAIRFYVIVGGHAGQFKAIPTIINVVAAFTSIGLATVLCDIILLNFLKGAEHYKSKKYEEVSGTVKKSRSGELCNGSQVTIKAENNSYDSYSNEHNA